MSKIVFPLAVVLTQDCDLEQGSRHRSGQEKPRTKDKKLFSSSLLRFTTPSMCIKVNIFFIWA